MRTGLSALHFGVRATLERNEYAGQPGTAAKEQGVGLGTGARLYPTVSTHSAKCKAFGPTLLVTGLAGEVGGGQH